MSGGDRKITLTYDDCYHLVHFYHIIQDVLEHTTGEKKHESGYVKAMEKITKEHMRQ